MSKFKKADIDYIRTDDGLDQDGTETIMFSWGIKGFGFGSTTFYYENEKLFCDNETLTKDQIKLLLCEFVDNAEFTS
jgi:hypothetical protein